ncbi:hypothetical protein IFM89_017465, partial [Coptis chinensis]
NTISSTSTVNNRSKYVPILHVSTHEPLPPKITKSNQTIQFQVPTPHFHPTSETKMHFFFAVLSAILTSSVSSQPHNNLPLFAFSWLNDANTIVAGTPATIKIKLVGNFDNQTNLHEHPINLIVRVNEKIGNSSYITGLCSNTEGDPVKWDITFLPILVGTFNVLIIDNEYNIHDSSLQFHVTPGKMYPSFSVAWWRGLVNEFDAGEKVTVLILPRDAFGNNVTSRSEKAGTYEFGVSALNETGSVLSVVNLTHLGWTGNDYVGIEFIATTCGNLSLKIEGGNQTLNGSPLPFKVKTGPLDITKCLAKWKYESNVLQVSSKLEMFIHQLDQYGNIVPGMYPFDVRVVEKLTNLSIPIADLYYKEVAPGIQIFKFRILKLGDFWLTFLNKERTQTISDMSYHFTVFVGYCDGAESVINGSGLFSSTVGQMSKFSVFLEDRHGFPSFVPVQTLRAQIMRTVDSYNVLPRISPIRIVEGRDIAGEPMYGASSPIGSAPAPSVGPNNILEGSSKVLASDFDVTYTPEKSGTYEIRVFCGNIPINDVILMEVQPGGVDVTLSKVVQFATQVPKLEESEIVVQLVDPFSNPILFQQEKLILHFSSSSGFLLWVFDVENGLYIGRYTASEVGVYELYVAFDGKQLLPCPFWVHVYGSEYFPKTSNDTITVWEDESVSFDVIGNDHYANGSARIVETSMPSHGSLLQYGRLFRYTPFKGFFGNDTFSYIISDINNNSASGTVFIDVLITAPQFVSLPVQLQATEDDLSPKFGGFAGIEIYYSDPQENISINLSAKNGTVFLSPMLMQFWQPTWRELSLDRGNGEEKSLILIGCVEVINLVLQSIQYLGNGNFSGEDEMKVSTSNKNGVRDTDIPISVEPINDPPFVNVSEYIILGKADKDGSRIFDRQKSRSEFFIGDPDFSSYQGNKSYFMISLSMEVSDGTLVTSLLDYQINTTEVKLENSYQWQPLQTYVTLSRHFLVKAKGIRFPGTIKDCNEAMEQLLYQGGERGAVLTLIVNDMGNHGCYPDCSESMTAPLQMEATVNLVRRSPMNPLLARTLGSAVVIEFILISLLGALVLFFICKCAFVLGNERRSFTRDSKISKVEKSKDPSSSDQPLSEDVTHFSGCCSSPFLLRSQLSIFRQRSCRQPVNRGPGNDESQSSQSSSDHQNIIARPNFMSLSIEKTQSENV